MGRQYTATLPDINYDNCLIASCLKKLFTKTEKSKAEPVYIIGKHIAEVKKELELVNKDNILEMSYPYLAAMEQSIPKAAFRYVVIYQKNIPVLFAYFQLFTLTSQNFTFEKNAGFVKGLLGFFLDLKRVKILVSGNALRNETASYCFNDTVLSHDEAAEIVVSVAEKIADDENTSALIVKDIATSARVRKWMTGLGYKMPWEDKVMTLDIDEQWDDMGSYVAALSRKYKTRANKILAAGSKLSVLALSEEEIVHHDRDIARLFKNVADAQSFVLTHPGHGHFSQLKKVYGDDFEVFGFFRGRELVAFYSAFIDDGAYELYYVGFDYALNSEYQLYFNILFSGLERVIQLGKRQLKLGRTSFDAKASIGAKPIDMEYFIKTANIPGAVNKWFANYFSSMEDAKWKLRNPLKQLA